MNCLLGNSKLFLLENKNGTISLVDNIEEYNGWKIISPIQEEIIPYGIA